MPLPFQMAAAALIAYVTRVSIPAAIAGTWISNPFTFPLCWFVQYHLGCWILRREPIHINSEHLMSSLTEAPLPFFVGIIPAAFLISAITYPVSLLLWDWISFGIHAAKDRRTVAKK
jgi:uncharacterized protein (DUF2062 family)